MIGVPKTMPADGDKRKCFYRCRNPAGGNAANAQTADLHDALVGGRQTWADPIDGSFSN